MRVEVRAAGSSMACKGSGVQIPSAPPGTTHGDPVLGGYTSSLAGAVLHDLGLHRATDLIGGYKAWEARAFGYGRSRALTGSAVLGHFVGS